MKRTIAVLALALGLGAAALAPAAASAATRAAASPADASLPALLACNGKPVLKPASFIISCADANALLSATHWSSWTATSATGSTRFGLNLCTPSCAASKISYFPASTVTLSAPVTTKKHGRLFSRMVIRYKLSGKTKAFVMSWKGEPAFS